MQPTLELFSASQPVFSSAGKWLHPLFELEDFLDGAGSGLDRASLSLRDRIAGKAAALLIVRLGITAIASLLETKQRMAFEQLVLECASKVSRAIGYSGDFFRDKLRS